MKTMKLMPALRSFRFRIVVMSTLLSGAVLLAFGLWTWEAVHRTSARRIDQTIRDLGARHLSFPQGPQYWRHVRESLEFVLGDLSGNPFIFLVKGRDGAVVHVSENWPEEIDATSFPTPIDAGFTEGPERFGPPHGGRKGQDNPQRDFKYSPPMGPPEAPPMGPPSGPPGGMRPFGPPPRGPMPVNSEPFYTTEAGGSRWRLGVMSSPEVTLVIGLNLAPYMAENRSVGALFLMAVPAALLLIALGGWLLAQRALKPVRRLTLAAENITAKGLDQRIPATQEDAEFARLVNVFNSMLERLDASFQQAVRFSADAAHELKTPLTILQGELAQAVQSSSDPGQQQTFSRLLEEVQRLKSITRKLLLLSLADSGRLKPQMDPVDFSELVAAEAEDLQIVAPHMQIRECIDPSLWTSGDLDLLRQVVQNLAGNSVKYNAPDGFIEIQLRMHDANIVLQIANSGPGIPENERDRVFERFYRADKSRNRRVDGVGLGLSLAREIVRAHGGELTLDTTRPGRTSFSATLPAIPPPEQ